MVATVGVYQLTGGADGGAGATENEIATSTRLQTKDQFVIDDTTYPVPIPAADFNYSYWIHAYLKITGGTFSKINNVKFWCDGSIDWLFGTSGELRMGNRDSGDKGAPMDTEYDVATGTEQTTGDEIEHATNGHDYYNGQTTKTVDVETHGSGNKAVLDSSDHTVTGKCKAVVLQVKVDTNATQGEQTDETLTMSYDEQ